ncbi:MAG: DUF1588 domain-containing protein, partial [Planctomycetales bacterium]|nr:DUF1588 domain-containing protein [Planctomycetales bacterium]
LIDDDRCDQFIDSFCGQWLDLRRITATQPDEHLYPEFDRLLLDSMSREPVAYFRDMLRNHRDIGHLIDSEYVFVNERLAKLYSIPDVNGVRIRRVDLPPDSPRGGFLGQAAILKVTANGTSTSPVTRGAWILDRLLGQPTPPPPPNVKAVEPDLRGTTTIREQLDKHRDVESCARCHRMIDPPGFALECFDVIGGYRQRYRSLEMGGTVEQTYEDERPVQYKLGVPVDTSGVAPGGQWFDDLNEFRVILLGDRRALAKSLVEKLLVYSTGAGIQFADASAVDQILEEAKSENYSLRSIIHAIVQSKVFQSK